MRKRCGFFKNSSGVGPGGSPVAIKNILFIRELVNVRTRIKASGQIISYQQIIDLFAAGADLLGTSSAQAIIDNSTVNQSDY